jgi:aspergillopepsin I
MSRAYRKFGFPFPEAVPVSRLDRSRSSNGTGDGEAKLQPNSAVPKIITSAQEADVEFLSPITIGGQSLNLDFDTGSADTCVHPPMGISSS